MTLPLCCLLLLAGPALRQGGPVSPIAPVPAGVAAPTIDGVLEEPAWRAAHPITDLRQVEPVAGAEPSERTEILLLYDPRTIYVGLVCHDREPWLQRATQVLRDANLDPDERVELLFDPFLDRRNGFWFQIGAAGSLGDALISRNGSFNKQWDGIWSGRARITETGWQAEIAIPVATINFDPATRAWGFNARRFVRRRSEEIRWAAAEPRIGFFSLANAGTIVGIEGLHQGLGIDARPFVLADVQHDHSADEEEFELDAGLDVFYRLSPSAKLAVSVNTDFAETEVDERRVNLTRFPLFFPEKRDFFLEDSGAFLFGPAGFGTPAVIPFFSRRIGLDPVEGVVPLRVAAKATAQTEGYSLGLLDVLTGAEGELDAENLFVGRFSRNVLEQSDVGVIWTHGDPAAGRPEPDRRDTLGADLNYRTDRFLGDRSLQVSAWILGTSTAGVDDDQLAYLGRIAYPNDEVELSLESAVIERAFDPALGFVARRGIARHVADLAWLPRPGGWIRQLEMRLRPELVTGTDGETESVDVQVRPLGIQLESGDELGLDLLLQREVLETDFGITQDVTIPAGSYGFQRYGIGLATSDKRPLDVSAAFTGGEFFDGEREDYELGLVWRTGRLLILGADLEVNDVRLRGGDFRVLVARGRVDLQFTPGLAWSSFLQWDDQSDVLGLNSRLWWIPRAGTEAFLVVNQGWDWDAAGFAPDDAEVTLKLGTTLRF